jgi:hypothetical protein
MERAGVRDVDSVQETQETQDDDKWEQVKVDPGHQFLLRCVSRTWHAKLTGLSHAGLGVFAVAGNNTAGDVAILFGSCIIIQMLASWSDSELQQTVFYGTENS